MTNLSNGEIDAFRRTLLKAALVSAPTTALAGCFPWLCRPEPICPNSPLVSRPDAPLTIDGHCHIFNGTDLQIKEFLSRVATRQGTALGVGARALGSLLEGLAWKFAPNGDDELRMLDRLSRTLEDCEGERYQEVVAGVADQQYQRARKELQRTLAEDTRFQNQLRTWRAPGFSVLSLSDQTSFAVAGEIEGLPERYEDFKKVRLSPADRVELLAARKSATGIVRFIVQNFQYRYVSAHDYLGTYNQSDARVIDLMVASLVDYDWPLARGASTITPLAKQIDVMERIAIATRGRVHGMAPFDPMREVAHRRGERGAFSALDFVKQAVLKRGFLGIKMYPPMGFAPYGNADLKGAGGGSFWREGPLPSWMADPGFGAALDAALADLYSWCEAEQVPLLAHTSISNGPTDTFQSLADWKYWELALKRWPGLRISFGHFGGTDLASESKAQVTGYLSLMQNTGKLGNHAFADAAYFADVLNQPTAVAERFRKLLADTDAKGDAALLNRFLYGTDWEMTLTEGGVSSYLREFEAVIAAAGAGTSSEVLTKNFFGLNATRWLGLAKGATTRMRLEAFYAKWKVKTPDWMTKVDKA